MKTALIVGATGMVGKSLVRLLLDDPRFARVIVFVRRATGIEHEKLEEHIISFDQPESWRDMVRGDVLFSALGTTLKQAGSQEEQYKVDYTYQYQFAVAASENGVPVYVLVSSAGADVKSRIFYSRIKGELECDVKSLRFQAVSILQPSLLVGERQEARTGEQLSYGLLKVLNAVGLFRKFRPIEGITVANAMRNAALQASPGIHTYALNEVFRLSASGAA